MSQEAKAREIAGLIGNMSKRLTGGNLSAEIAPALAAALQQVRTAALEEAAGEIEATTDVDPATRMLLAFAVRRLKDG